MREVLVTIGLKSPPLRGRISPPLPHPGGEHLHPVPNRLAEISDSGLFVVASVMLWDGRLPLRKKCSSIPPKTIFQLPRGQKLRLAPVRLEAEDSGPFFDDSGAVFKLSFFSGRA
jgi:hypothetical protein